MSAATEQVTQTGQGYGTFPYRTYVLLTLTMVYTFNFIDRILITVVGRKIIDDFELSNFEYGLLTGTGFAVLYAIMGIPIANFSERYSRVRIIGICVILWSIATALCGVTVGFFTLLVTRALVGIGEAGCTPPANSVISDYYPQESRATALGIYAMGITFGGVLAQLFGGYIILNFTWREAFFFLGLPGILVGLLVLFTIKEPPRGYSDPPGSKKQDKADFGEALKEIMSKPTFWVMAAGATIAAFAGYSLTSFMPLFVQYVHGLSAGDTAIYYMAPIGIAGTAGAFAGGYLVDLASKRSATAPTWLPAVGFVLSVPAYLIGFYSGSLMVMLIGFMFGGFLHYFYLGAQYNIGQSVVSARTRATAIAVLLFVVNIIGYGAGPPIVGLIADYFTSSGIAQSVFVAEIDVEACKAALKNAAGGKEVGIADNLLAECKAIRGDANRITCVITGSLYLLAGVLFFLSGRTFLKDRASVAATA